MANPAFLLDTNICIYVLNDAASRLTARMGQQDSGSLAISAITLAEIAVGYGDQIDTDAGLLSFRDAVAVLPFDAGAARAYARLPFRRARYDRLIAAHALSVGLTLVTNDERDFADIPGLRVENWTQ